VDIKRLILTQHKDTHLERDDDDDPSSSSSCHHYITTAQLLLLLLLLLLLSLSSSYSTYHCIHLLLPRLQITWFLLILSDGDII